MTHVNALRDAFPEAARDVRLNLGAVLEGGVLTAGERWGVAVASAAAPGGSVILLEAIEADARAAVGDAVIEDAHAAAVLMGMNNVYYRFRHVIGKDTYAGKPARLRMNRLAAPATTKVDLELFCLAVSAINGCEACMRAHEAVVRAGGLTADHVHEAIRLAATVRAAGVAAMLSRDAAAAAR